MAAGLTPRVFWALVPLVAHSITGCAKMSPQGTALIEYRRSGGIAGREDRLVVLTDGTVRLSRRGAVTDYRISADTLNELRALLERVDFRRMREEYLPTRRGADLFEYEVIYQGRRIRTMDTAVPPELQPLLQLLSGFASRPP